MSLENPYQITVLHSRMEISTERRSRIQIFFWWCIFLYPAITLSLIYLSWIITTISLGRAPEFGEMPTQPSMELAVTSIGTCGALLTLASPLLTPIGLLATIAWPFGSGRRKLRYKLFCPGMYLLQVAITVTLFHYDPLKALSWFWD